MLDGWRRAALDECRVAANSAREWHRLKSLPTVQRHSAGVRSFGTRYARWLVAKAAGRECVRDVELFWGGHLRVDIEDYDGKVLYLAGTLFDAETPLTAWLIRNLGPDDVFYDVGANWGFFSALAGTVCGATVHSFEPNPRVAAALRLSVGADRHVSVAEVALGATALTTRLHVPGGHSGAGTVVAEASSAADAVDVTQQTLDAYAEANGPPTVIKLDVEGYEDEVLRGAAHTLETHEAVVIMEVHHRTSGTHLAREMRAVERLRELGYRQFAISDEGIAEPCGDGEAELNRVTKRFGYANLLFNRSGRAELPVTG